MTVETHPETAGWEAVVGLEVHVRLLTRSKLFSAADATFGAAPNTHVSEVCAGLPGALPVLNRKAVDLALTAGFALGCELQPRSRFARKHYFYPDLPKGYQISQYEEPLCLGGRFEYPADDGWKTCRLTRIHLEEDAGKLVHGAHGSVVDLNRAGVPLIEIVTEPDLRAPEDAAALLRELRVLCRDLGVSDCNMEEGSLRCDANVSVRRQGEAELAVRTEVKNLNSFRFVEKALRFEIRRQIAVYRDGGQVVQETRLFDERQGTTRPMRGKEEAEDYRYFPDPDLPPLVVDDAWAGRAQSEVPEIPALRLRRYEEELGLARGMARQLVRGRETATYFEAAVRAGAAAKTVAAWMTQYLLPAAGSTCVRETGITPEDLALLDGRLRDGELSKTLARKALAQAIASRRPLPEILEELAAVSEDVEAKVRAGVVATLEKHAVQVAEYRAGKDKLFGYLLGQTLRSVGASADPVLVRELLRRALLRRALLRKALHEES